jgi:hypothetical protein
VASPNNPFSPFFNLFSFSLYDKKSNQILKKSSCRQQQCCFFFFLKKLSPGCPPLTSHAIQRERSFFMRPSFLPYFTRKWFSPCLFSAPTEKYWNGQFFFFFFFFLRVPDLITLGHITTSLYVIP